MFTRPKAHIVGQRERLLSGVLHRYGERLQLEHESLSTLTETVGRDTLNLTAGLGLTYLVDEPEAVEETDKAASDANAQSAEQKLPPSEGVPPSASREHADIALQQKTAGGHGSAQQEEDLLGGSELPGPESAQTTADILLNYVAPVTCGVRQDERAVRSAMLPSILRRERNAAPHGSR